MDGFTFEIVGTAEKADKSIDRVLEKLDRIPPAAYKAGSGIEGASQRAAGIVAMLAANTDRVNAALQREREVFDSIRGPMEKNAQDMQALQQLYGAGAISAYEYTTAVTKLRDAIIAQNRVHVQAPSSGGGFNVGAALGGLPGGSLIAGAAGGGVAGFAQAGLQAAIGGAHQIIEMADAYTGLQNRLVALTDSQEKASALFDQLNESADKTRSDLNSTANAFVTFNRALQGLHVSQAQVLAFTEHLNETITLGGTDAVGASNAMIQLSQALASGTLRGQDFNSIISQAPTLLEPIAAHLHTTVGALRQMAEDGKITAQVIFDSYEGQGGAGARIERAFGKSVPTIGQQFQIMKNDAGAAVGKLMADADAAAIVAAAMDKAKDAISLAAAQMKLWLDLYKEGKEYGLDAKFWMSGGIDNLKEFANATGFVDTMLGRHVDLQKQLAIALRQSAHDTVTATQVQNSYNQSLHDGLGGVSSLASKLTSTFANKGLYAFVDDPWFVAPDSAAKIQRVSHQLDILADIRRRLATEKAHAQLQPEYGDDLILKKLSKAGDAEQLDDEKAYVARVTAITDAQTDVQARAAEIIAKNGEEVAKAEDAMVKHNQEAAQQVREAWAASAGSIAGDLISAFAEGDQSITKSVEHAIAQLALLELKQAAASVGGSGGAFLTALVGAVALPGHANGTQFMVGGQGGTDQNIVAFRASNDERVTVETSADRQSGKYFGRGGGNVTIAPTFKVLMPVDDRDIVDDSRSGLTTLVKLERQLGRKRR